MRLKPIPIVVAIFLALIFLCQSVYAGLSRTQVSQIAKEITVMIDGCQSGSGAIFQREGNVYSVLTVKHAVSKEISSCLIIDAEGDRYQIDNNNVEQFKDLDLAVVKFSSGKNYKVGVLGDSSKVIEGQTVYVTGYPAPTSLVNIRSLIVSSGAIVGISKQPSEGYAFIYDNSTQPGMSGGAVLDEDGKIIGIHGQGGEKASGKSGLNLGIPIHFYIAAKQASKPIPVEPSPEPIQPVTQPTSQLSEQQEKENLLLEEQRKISLARSEEIWCVGGGGLLTGFALGLILIFPLQIGKHPLLHWLDDEYQIFLKSFVSVSIVFSSYCLWFTDISPWFLLLGIILGIVVGFFVLIIFFSEAELVLTSIIFYPVSILLGYKGFYVCGREALTLNGGIFIFNGFNGDMFDLNFLVRLLLFFLIVAF